MSLLIDIAPKSVSICGKDFKINSDFRTAILFEQMMFDDDFPDRLKTVNAIRLFYPVMPQDTEKALDKLIWFYSCGKEHLNNKGHVDTSSRYYDFDYDDDYIFAAFMQQYNIDLENIEYLHWWKFNAMFKALPDSCEIVKIMGYRSIKIDSKMSDGERKFYTKMKRLHALPLSRSENEKLSEIEKILMQK